MKLHPWWEAAAKPVADPASLSAATTAFKDVLDRGIAGARLVEVRAIPSLGVEALHVDVDVERPQDLAFPLRAIEPLAILVPVGRDASPGALPLREDFPETPHRNWTPDGVPLALCVDDRPWSEAKLTFRQVDFIRRVQSWLAKAAGGQLHDTARPLDPIFYSPPRSLVIPRFVLDPNLAQGNELVGFVHAEDQAVITARPLAEFGGRVPDRGRLVVTTLRAREQQMMALRHAPSDLASLGRQLKSCGVDLVEVLHRLTREWAGLQGDDLRRLSSSVVIVVVFPVRSEDGSLAENICAFVTDQSAGEIGLQMGSIHRNESGVGSKSGYLKALTSSRPDELPPLSVEPLDVHLAFDGELARQISGPPATTGSIALIGGGAIGSQIGDHLAREGYRVEAVVDCDRLLPHNLARHALAADAVGLPKAMALAYELTGIRASAVEGIFADVLAPGRGSERLDQTLDNAEIILDASASVAVSRQLSDRAGAARRISAFFNPAGNAVVVLAESADRAVKLRDLEAQYHRIIQEDERLHGHLTVETAGLRYSGSCRSLTNRISSSNAGVLSALATAGVKRALNTPEATIRIWTLSDQGEVALVEHVGQSTTTVEVGGWNISFDSGFAQRLHAERQRHLPAETGGVLLGMADFSRRSIHLVTSLPAPADSTGSISGFDRGVEGLEAALKAAAERSLHHVRYIGEWHSHPSGSSALPSVIDLRQLDWLRRELEIEGLPALMAIAADSGQTSFIIDGRKT